MEVAHAATAPSDPIVGAAASSQGGGWETTSSGQVTAIGGAPSFGSVTSPLNRPIVGMAATPDGGGYWLVASDGGIFAFGDAAFYGSTGALRLNKPVVGMASTVDGGGYWLVASDGGIFAFGDAAFYGSTGALHLNQPVVGMAATPDGGGYWLVASDGGIFTFGDAAYDGSTGSMHLNQPVVGMAATPDGGGYWLVASDGGVFTFGDAPFLGSEGASSTRIAALAPLSGGNGYYLAEANGNVIAFGHRGNPPVKTSPVTAPPVTTPPVTTPPVTTPPATTPPPPSPTSKVGLGVLLADPNFMTTDQANGINTATLNLSWSVWEPTQGTWYAAYQNEIIRQVNAYHAAGWKVNVDLGLQQPPSWALALPDGQLRDQHGGSSSTADFEYSTAVRSAAAQYIQQVVSVLPNVQGYRIGLSENGETLYPDTQTNQWWAFNTSSQSGGSDLPAGVGTSPMPGWVPGTSTWNGSQVTASQVQTWYSWYSGAMVNAHAWEMSTIRNAGFTGQLQLVMPGMGALPGPMAARLANDLLPGSYDSFYTLNTAAIWWQMLDSLPTLSGAVVDISSVYDYSGANRATGCQIGDSAVAYNDPQIYSWTDTRFLASLAHRHGLPVIGENPGGDTAADLAPMIALADSCGLSTLQWAWDYTLYQGGTPVTVSQLGAAAR